MNTKQIAIIKQTVPVLHEHGEALTRLFYQNLFKNNPEVKQFFNNAHQVKGTQQRALANAICAYAENIENPEVLANAVNLIAHKHVSLGIKAQHYPIVGQNLILTIKELLGDAANDDVIDAWTTAYGELADIFVAHEKSLYGQQKELYGWNGVKPFRLVNKVQESSNIVSFYLQSEDGSPLTAHKPGQYITIHLTIDGTPVMRNYSLSNAPGSDTYRISVKKELGPNADIPDGLVSNHLHDYYGVGDSLDLAPPSGDFTLQVPADETQPIVMIAGGVGITPIISMLHALFNDSSVTSRPVYLFQCVNNLSVLPFNTELSALVSSNPNFHWQVHLSQQSSYEMDLMANIHLGRFAFDDMEQLFERDEPLAIHACGPSSLIKSVSEMVNLRKNPNDSFHYEFFGPAQAM